MCVAPVSICGNGVVDDGEGCDDGNTDHGDGCSYDCKQECPDECSIWFDGCNSCLCEAGAIDACTLRFCPVENFEPTACVEFESACGNGTLDDGEECDDGNTTGRDGCSSSCTVDDVCPVPSSGCFQLTKPETPILQIRDKSPDKKDLLRWLWNKGQCTRAEDFGDPTSSTSIAFELFDGGSVVFSAAVPAAGTCGPKGKDCWKAVKGGFKFVDPDATTGVKSLLLKSGADGKSKILLVAKGEGVGPPALPLAGPATARLTTSDGTCFEASYSTFSKNEPELLKAKSD